MIEYRTAKAGAVADESGVLVGLVTPFNTKTVIGDLKRGGFREENDPGAFTKTLQEQDIVLIHNHNTAMPMARTSVPYGQEGGLSLAADPRAGLRAEAIPVDTTYARDVVKLARAKVLKGMSYGFEVIRDEWTDDEGRDSNAQVGTNRRILEARIHEVTTTAFPAYVTTELSARDAVNAARGVEGARAAKATYSDLDTCGSCGSENEYGAYCGACGTAMASKPDDGDTYCTSCGSEIDDSSRSSHICATRSEKPGDQILDAAAQLLTAYNALPEDLRATLPVEVREAIEALDNTGSADSEHNEAGSTTSNDEEDESAEHERSSKIAMFFMAEAFKDDK